MTKRTRTVLFCLLGTIFLLGTPAIILYSQGYRFDWEERWFFKVGAFYFSAIPTRAEVFVNEKSIGQTARVLGTILTKNFPSNTYHIRIQKEGYHAWEKQLEVFEKQVTEAKHIVLLPVDPAFVVLKDDVQAFWFAPNKTEAILQKSNSKNTWTLVFWDTKENVEYPLYESSLAQDEVWDLRWALNSNSFLFRIASKEQLQSFIQRLDRNLLTRQKTNAESLRIAVQLRTLVDQLGAASQQISFSPFGENQLLALVPSRNSFVLSQFDSIQKQPATSLAQNVVTFLANDHQVLWLNQDGILWQQQSTDTQAVQLNQIPFPVQPETPYAIYLAGNEFFIQENQTLYLLNPQTQVFEEFFVSLKEMILSPDGKKLALSSGKEIWIYFLQEDQEQPSHSKGEKVFLTRFGENVTNLIWFGAHYLLFARGDAIIASEIDNRDRLNMVELATFSHPTLFLQNVTETLLVHTKDQIRVSEKLLP
ncbi:MAG: PEGA domain-containing protein [Patescibacteria group bacterium]